MLRRSIGALVLLVAAAVLGAGGGGSTAPRWNVVLITLDTTRADHLGCYGYAAAATPRIDALAASSLRFERAYTAVPITLPSHATMLTGLLPPNMDSASIASVDSPTASPLSPKSSGSKDTGPAPSFRRLFWTSVLAWRAALTSTTTTFKTA
ncbi:MAG: sulfatase-like hydrolase/transferase [Planctomycetaceae bacterium]